MSDIREVLVNDLVFKYSNGEAFDLAEGEVRFIEATPDGAVLGLYKGERLVRRWSVTVTDLGITAPEGVLSVERLRNFLDGREPSSGGYGSYFQFEQNEEGVVVNLVAEWKPHDEEPTALVTDINEEAGRVTYSWPGPAHESGAWDDPESETVGNFVRRLGEYGDY